MAIAGAVGGVTRSTNLGYVGTSTDTGHSGGSGSFGLNPDGTLNYGLIKDFADDGIRPAAPLGGAAGADLLRLGADPQLLGGCSTGGRQGHYLAQNFPDFYDGILAGANAYNWDRFITAELWPASRDEPWVGAPIAGAKLTAVKTRRSRHATVWTASQTGSFRNLARALTAQSRCSAGPTAGHRPMRTVSRPPEVSRSTRSGTDPGMLKATGYGMASSGERL